MRPPTSPAFVSDDPLVGTVLGGRYDLSGVLGRGGMGTVYRASRQDTGQIVAVKVLRRELADAPDARERFEREARAAARLSHPACVAVRDFGHDPAGAYLVMELCRGRSLAAIIGEGPLDPVVAARIAERVLAGLAHAHSLGVVHRDLKPENIMVGEVGLVKILDFGLARVLGDAERSAEAHAGTVMGTPEYLSPEQCLGDAGDARSDLYSVGVVLFEMLTGKRPFHGKTPRELHAQHIAKPAPAPSTLAPASASAPTSGPADAPAPAASAFDAPSGFAGPGATVKALDPVVLRALAKSPSERFADAAEMRAALLEACPDAVSPELGDELEARGRAPWTQPGWASPGAPDQAQRGLGQRFRALAPIPRAFIVAGVVVVLLALTSVALSRACAGPPPARGLVARETASAAALGHVRAALDRGDVPGAERLAEALVHDNPDDPRAFLLLGHALCASRDKERGLAAYREAVRLDRLRATSDAELWANLRATFADRRFGEAAFGLAEKLGPGAARLLTAFAEETKDKRLKARALAAAKVAAAAAEAGAPANRPGPGGGAGAGPGAGSTEAGAAPGGGARGPK
jgi:serine/threonine-protein kinase